MGCRGPRVRALSGLILLAEYEESAVGDGVLSDSMRQEIWDDLTNSSGAPIAWLGIGIEEIDPKKIRTDIDESRYFDTVQIPNEARMPQFRSNQRWNDDRGAKECKGNPNDFKWKYRVEVSIPSSTNPLDEAGGGSSESLGRASRAK